MFMCVFDRDTCRAPTGLESPRDGVPVENISMDEDRRNAESMERLRSIKDMAASRAEGKPPVNLKMMSLGLGNAVAIEQSSLLSSVLDGDIVAVLRGQVTAWPGMNAVTEAHDAFVRGESEDEVESHHMTDAQRLVRLYKYLMDLEHGHRDLPHAISHLSAVEGAFAFVLYDRIRRNVMVARDREGKENLYWGCSPDGTLMLADSWRTLNECNPSAVSFPAGCLFANEGCTFYECPGSMGWVMGGGHAWPGRLHSFAKPGRTVQAVPRINSRGQLCGAVFRVASGPDIAAMGMRA
eukprot:jgi/Chlat1/6779/Chrsp50S06453